MVWQNMEVAPLNSGYQRQVAFQKKITLDIKGVTPWVLIPDQVVSVQVTVEFTGGASGNVEATTELIEEIKNENVMDGVQWDLGEVSTRSQDTASPPTAIRGVMTQQGVNGTMIITMRAQ
jgi:hypothetical protein